VNRSDLESAARAHDELKSAERSLDSLLSADFKITGVTLERSQGSIHPIVLHACGSGAMYGLDFTTELQGVLTQAFNEYFRSRVLAAQEKLTSLGIEF
jgi:hypothetical protein